MPHRMMQAPSRRVLLVDDSEGEYFLVQRLLAGVPGQPYLLHWANSVVDAYELLACEIEYDAILLDYRLDAGATGFDVLRELVARGVRSPIIMLTVVADEELDQRCLRAGAADYLVKSDLGTSLLHRTIGHAIERQRMQADLARSEHRYRTLAARFPKGFVLLLDRTGRCVLADGEGLQEIGLRGEDLIGRPLEHLLPEDLVRAIREQRDRAPDQRTERFEAAFRGRIYLVNLACLIEDEGPDMLAVFHDVSDVRSAEQAVLQAARMAAVGTLASGVAHEYNNLHAIVVGLLEQLRRKHQLPEDASGKLDRIERTVWRAAEVTHNLLTFARGRQTSFVIADLADVVAEVVALVEEEFSCDGVELSVQHAELPSLLLQPSSISQVVMNLLINARQALPPGGERRIAIATRAEGEWAVLEVSDTGCGIAPEDRERIFLPFYTTKGGGGTGDRDAGSGLGLSVCRTIVEHHGGRIRVASEPGRGATFAVHLPLRLVGQQLPHPSPEEEQRYRILIVEEDLQLRRRVGEALRGRGWQTSEASDGLDALDLVTDGGIDLVLVAQRMPRMDAVQFLDFLRALPRPPAVLLLGDDGSGGRRVREQPALDGPTVAAVDLDALCEAVSAALGGDAR